MKHLFFVMIIIGLAACGVDGEPVKPTGAAEVTLSSSGAHLGGVIGVRQGPVTLSLGF